MPITVPEGYMTMNSVYAHIRERTGYGRLVADNAIQRLAAAGAIRFFEHPGHKNAKLMSKEDVEKVIVALTTINPA